MAIYAGLHNGEEMGERDGGVDGFRREVGRWTRHGSGASGARVRHGAVRWRRIGQAAAARAKGKEGPRVGPAWRRLGSEEGTWPAGRFGPDGLKRPS
jgi:hypothetical protein